MYGEYYHWDRISGVQLTLINSRIARCVTVASCDLIIIIVQAYLKTSITCLSDISYLYALWWLRIYKLCFIIIIKSEVWTTTHPLGLGLALWGTAPGDAFLERSIENRCIKKFRRPCDATCKIGHYTSSITLFPIVYSLSPAYYNFHSYDI